MITKEERDSIRTMHSDYVAYECIVHGGSSDNKNIGFYTKGHRGFKEFMVDGFPALLDKLCDADRALDVFEAELGDSISKNDYEELESECDYWKFRAEALEQAFLGDGSPCDHCKHVNVAGCDEPCCRCRQIYKDGMMRFELAEEAEATLTEEASE